MSTKQTLRAVRWSFGGDGPTFEGYTDGTTWNGWQNVWVSPGTHHLVLAWLGTDDKESFEELTFDEYEVDGEKAMLFSYAYGFCTCIEEPERIVCATLNTRHFTFRAYGENEEVAEKLLRRAWDEKHRGQYSCVSAEEYFAKCGGDALVEFREIELGTVTRDGEEIYNRT